MKKSAWMIAFLLIVNGVFAMIPKQEKLFQSLAIKVPAKKKVQYVFGDHIAGYYEGYTHTYQKGAGYQMMRTALYRDFGSLADGKILNRKSAAYSLILPYGMRTVYTNGVYDTFMLHGDIYAISLQVHSDKAARLALLPLLTVRKKRTVVEQKGNIVLIYPEKARKYDFPVYMAFSSPDAFRYYQADRDKTPGFKKIFHLSKIVLGPVFESKKKLNDFTIHIAFGFSKEDALKKAKKMAKNDAVAEHKKKIYDFLTRSYFVTDDPDFNRAVMWSKLSAYSLVNREYGCGIWAGLPWFKDNWGRDTFISLPGTLLVSGEFKKALAVMTNFSTFQDRGRDYLTVRYKDNDQKKKIISYIRANFGRGIRIKRGEEGGVIGHTLDRQYLDRPDELKKKIERMKRDLPGLDIKVKLVIDKTYGRIPNRVSGNSIIYNTTDGTPWLIREMYEYLRYTGDTKTAKLFYPVLKRALDGAIKNYVDAQGFLTHANADTWMDARINGGKPWSARGNRAVEIQALWYNALLIGEEFARDNGDSKAEHRYRVIAARLKKHFMKVFWNKNRRMMADRVTKKGRQDLKVRPNQLMLLTVPLEKHLVGIKTEARVLKNAVSKLLYPYGIASLSQDNPYFHPYHEDWSHYNKDAAYHNGTVWGWNAGFTISALSRFNEADFAYKLSENLANQILYQGCRGSMSEVMDALQKNPLKLKLTGTYSQAWSVAEFARNAYQNYAGFQPNLLQKEIVWAPLVPDKWNTASASLRFDGKASFVFEYKKEGTKQHWTVKLKNYGHSLRLIFRPGYKAGRRQAVMKLKSGKALELVYDPETGKLSVNGESVKTTTAIPNMSKIIGKLKFVKPNFDKKYPVLQGKDVLQHIIEKGQYK